MNSASTFSSLMPQSFFEQNPKTLTLLTTYRCNAQCEQCCFESHPNIEGRLSLEEMCNYIDRAVEDFPALQVVVFSGGECFLLGDDLIKAISHASKLGLSTRCVTNGFWGRNKNTARKNAKKLAEAGITEINISTGLDHQQWVPQQSIIKAVSALLEESIRTLLVVESDSLDSNISNSLCGDSEFAKYLRHPKLTLKSNSWMAFNDKIVERKNTMADDLADEACDQIFETVTITPYKKLSACCGLTLEYIKEVQLGDLDSLGSNLVSMYWSQLDDFLKIWIHMDGPTKIIRLLLGEEAVRKRKFVHKCESCSVLHNDPEIRKALEESYLLHAPEVLSRFMLKQTAKDAEYDSVRMILEKNASTSKSSVNGIFEEA